MTSHNCMRGHIERGRRQQKHPEATVNNGVSYERERSYACSYAWAPTLCATTEQYTADRTTMSDHTCARTRAQFVYFLEPRSMGYIWQSVCILTSIVYLRSIPTNKFLVLHVFFYIFCLVGYTNFVRIPNHVIFIFSVLFSQMFGPSVGTCMVCCQLYVDPHKTLSRFDLTNSSSISARFFRTI